MVLICGSLMISDGEHLFMYVVFRKMSIQILCPFFNQVFFFFFNAKLSEFLYILDINSLLAILFVNVLPFSGLSFHFADSFLCCIKAF